MKNKIIKTGSWAAFSFALLKAFRDSADPYTRIAIGGSLSFGMLVLGGSEARVIAIGTGIGSIVQGAEILKGGRINKNRYSQTIFTLHETEGVLELPPNSLPDYNCDGFTLKGLNGVYKISDGVYSQIDSKGNVNISGLGAVVNKINGGGFHDYEWCVKTGDKRWVDLYKKSI